MNDNIAALVRQIPELRRSEQTSLYIPGGLSLYWGPMKSGKTTEMLSHLHRAGISHIHKYQLFKPSNDIRGGAMVFSRVYGNVASQPILKKQPGDILNYVCKDTQIVGIDEAQFFDESLADIVMALRLSKRHVLCAFLDTDFRGVPFASSLRLMASGPSASIKLNAVCDKQPCSIDATMTQRLVNGLPAHYDDPVEVIEQEGRAETYEARCIFHHEVRYN